MLGVIGAMEEEVALIKEQMRGYRTRSCGGTDFFEGILNGKPLVLCKTGVGKVHAAYAASVLALRYNITALIFTGVAGSAHPDLKLGDIVLATDCLYHDMDATAMGWKISEIPDGSPSLFPCDPRINAALNQAASSVCGSSAVYQGRIVTGDQFIADSEKVQKLHQRFKAYAVDMESAAVAHIALKSHIPCGIVRSISDKANNEASFDYSHFMSEMAERSAHLVSAGIRLI